MHESHKNSMYHKTIFSTFFQKIDNNNINQQKTKFHSYGSYLDRSIFRFDFSFLNIKLNRTRVICYMDLTMKGHSGSKYNNFYKKMNISVVGVLRHLNFRCLVEGNQIFIHCIHQTFAETFKLKIDEEKDELCSNFKLIQCLNR